ncbi:hypothetical protein L1887_57289 [Cichorium endivia]|nr:hypothetical protein L1887_57289 [Cichorium endivia]
MDGFERSRGGRHERPGLACHYCILKPLDPDPRVSLLAGGWMVDVKQWPPTSRTKEALKRRRPRLCQECKAAADVCTAVCTAEQPVSRPPAEKEERGSAGPETPRLAFPWMQMKVEEATAILPDSQPPPCLPAAVAPCRSIRGSPWRGEVDI